MDASTTESGLTLFIIGSWVSADIRMWNRECTLAQAVSTTGRAGIQVTLGSQATAVRQKCARGEVDLDSLVDRAHLDLVESPLMLSPLRENQQWARTDVSSERMMKYQLLQKCFPAAAETAPRLEWKQADLILNRYPSVSLGQPVKLRHQRELPVAHGRRRARSQRGRQIGQASTFNRYSAGS